MSESGGSPFDRSRKVQRTPPFHRSKSRKRAAEDEEMFTIATDLSVMKSYRKELEEFLFNDSNKINNAAKQSILTIYSKMENVAYKTLQDNAVLHERIQYRRGVSDLVDMVEQSVASINDIVKQPPTPMPSYASVLRPGGSKSKAPVRLAAIRKDFKVIVKGAGDNVKDSEEVKQKILNQLKSDSRQVKVQSLRKLKDKSVILELPTSSDMDIVKNAIGKTPELQLQEPSKLLPRLIIYDFPNSVTQEVIVDEIVSKNLDTVLTDRDNLKSEIKILFKTKSKIDNKHNVVVSVSARVRKALVEQGRIFVEFGSYKLNDFISLTRCYNCQGFGHTAKVCNAKTSVCGHCSNEGHSFKDCPNKAAPAQCINCKNKNKPSDHSVRDKQCAEYVRNFDMFINKIDYGQ